MPGLYFKKVMDTISVKGETYIKGSKIAKELGYTADYVGQLCRNGQIEGTLVGRSWYVSEKSIRAHKKNRYRSNITKASNSVRQMVEENINSLPPSYLKEPLTTAYEEDEAPLFPRIGKLDAENVLNFEERAAIVATASTTAAVESESFDEEVVPVPSEPEAETDTNNRVRIIRQNPRPPEREEAIRTNSHMISAAANSPLSKAQPKYSSGDRTRHTYGPTVTLLAVVCGVFILVVTLGLERRSFVSPITPPDNYYHFNPGAGLEAASILWSENFR